MSQTIKLPNFNTPNIRQDSQLTSDHTAGGYPQLTMENSNGFESPSSALVGNPGAEDSEIVALVDALDDIHSSIATALKFNHKEGTPVYLLYGINIKVYRAPNVSGLAPAVAQFASIATVAIQPDSLTTLYTDPDGGSGFWYRFTYVGPNGETNLEDCEAVRGGSVGVYCSLDLIREAAGFEHARYITDQMISPHRATAQSVIDSALQGQYVVPFADPINPQIEAIAKTLAAGYLMQEQYPSQPERGDAKVKAAMASLAQIQSGQMVLLNAVGSNEAITEAILGEHWPNETTPDTPRDQGGSSRYFRMDDVRNDYDRRY